MNTKIPLFIIIRLLRELLTSINIEILNSFIYYIIYQKEIIITVSSIYCLRAVLYAPQNFYLLFIEFITIYMMEIKKLTTDTLDKVIMYSIRSSILVRLSNGIPILFNRYVYNVVLNGNCIPYLSRISIEDRILNCRLYNVDSL